MRARALILAIFAPLAWSSSSLFAPLERKATRLMEQVEAAPGEATEGMKKGLRRLIGLSVGWDKIRTISLEAAGTACGASALLGRGHPRAGDAAQAAVLAGFVRDSIRAPRSLPLSGEADEVKEDLPVAELAAVAVAGMALAASHPGLISREAKALVLPVLSLFAMCASTSAALAAEAPRLHPLISPALAALATGVMVREARQRELPLTTLASSTAGGFLLIISGRSVLRHNWADMAECAARYASPALRTVFFRFDWSGLVRNSFDVVKTASEQAVDLCKAAYSRAPRRLQLAAAAAVGAASAVPRVAGVALGVCRGWLDYRVDAIVEAVIPMTAASQNATAAFRNRVGKLPAMQRATRAWNRVRGVMVRRWYALAPWHLARWGLGIQLSEPKPGLAASLGMLSLLLPSRWGDPCAWLCAPLIDRPVSRAIAALREATHAAAAGMAAATARRYGLRCRRAEIEARLANATAGRRGAVRRRADAHTGGRRQELTEAEELREFRRREEDDFLAIASVGLLSS
jgi:hypothetical protein